LRISGAGTEKQAIPATPKIKALLRGLRGEVNAAPGMERNDAWDKGMEAWLGGCQVSLNTDAYPKTFIRDLNRRILVRKEDDAITRPGVYSVLLDEGGGVRAYQMRERPGQGKEDVHNQLATNLWEALSDLNGTNACRVSASYRIAEGGCVLRLYELKPPLPLAQFIGAAKNTCVQDGDTNIPAMSHSDATQLEQNAETKAAVLGRGV
jgi:hypothetical protein